MSAASKTVFVALSGGVDSSVAALLLRNRGYRVVGVFMRCYNLDGCAEYDAEDARRVAEKLGIPFYAWDFEEEYKKKVVEYMVDGYRRGVTPNPDVMCNKEIKFGLFFARARAAGADCIATGHYARRVARSVNRKDVARYTLHVARDAQKDQSYFLWTLTQRELARCLFPIGNYLKPEVRRMAKRAGLPTAEKKDSQGICFLGKVTLADFLKEYIPEKRGPVLTVSGKKVGEHQGAYFYTIGQRHGLGISAPRPYYVAEKDVCTNTIVIAEGSEHPALYRKEVELTAVNFIRPLLFAISCLPILARVRYRQPLAPATLTISISNSRELENKKKRYTLRFSKPQKFVAPGQSAVFYTRSGEMLGGGIIV